MKRDESIQRRQLKPKKPPPPDAPPPQPPTPQLDNLNPNAEKIAISAAPVETDIEMSGGFSLGATDDYGYYAVANKVHMHDLHATILYALGLDHERLTYRYAGRDFRLTDVYGRAVTELFA